eukprot:344633_1
MNVRQLFENKINSVSARVLLDGLNMERSMFHKMELSKRLIHQNKWQPKVNEKIRLVELTKLKPWRSYPATIQKASAKQIAVTYDGYPDTPMEWVKKNQWAGRVTILEDNKSQSSATNLAQGQKLNKNNKTASVRNVVQQGQKGDVGRKLGKRVKSVPPTNVPFVPPFRNKKVAIWDNDDITDWIDSITIDAEPRHQAKITQNKLNFKTAAFKNKLTGKLLLKYKNGDKLFKDYKQYKLSQAFCNNVFGQLKNIVNAEAKGNTSSYKKPWFYDPSPPYSPPDKNDHKTNVYQNEPPKEPARVEFYEGQKIDAKDAGWHSA